MGKDVEWKSFFEDNHRYADIINGIGCGGMQVVKDTDLTEVDTASKKKSRENAKGLDAGEYMYGFKKDSKLNPLVTFVLYTGKEAWEGSNHLHDMLNFTNVPDKLKEMVPDYKINVIDVRKIENTEVFHTDVRQVFDFI